MSTEPEAEIEREAPAELSPRARLVGVVLWASFLAAAAATMVAFAFIDPDALRAGSPPGWWSGRRTVYALGFFFFWLAAAGAAAVTAALLKPSSGRR